MEITYPEEIKLHTIARALKLNRPERLWLKCFDTQSGRQVALQDATGWDLDQVIKFAWIQEAFLDRNVQIKREV